MARRDRQPHMLTAARMQFRSEVDADPPLLSASTTDGRITIDADNWVGILIPAAVTAELDTAGPWYLPRIDDAANAPPGHPSKCGARRYGRPITEPRGQTEDPRLHRRSARTRCRPGASWTERRREDRVMATSFPPQLLSFCCVCLLQPLVKGSVLARPRTGSPDAGRRRSADGAVEVAV